MFIWSVVVRNLFKGSFLGFWVCRREFLEETAVKIAGLFKVIDPPTVVAHLGGVLVQNSVKKLILTVK